MIAGKLVDSGRDGQPVYDLKRLGDALVLWECAEGEGVALMTDEFSPGQVEESGLEYSGRVVFPGAEGPVIDGAPGTLLGPRAITAEDLIVPYALRLTKPNSGLKFS